ncbi:MAG TPA: helix-turn-helix domain-containing protein [Candidatus Polarisedimenticolia bacterium]|jgi:predicted DNA-binding transcriptional regulator AlpA|nr:helix-turn-helix domain-containing protein [Candidatus Polarisedimenticolia bacterium]
MVQKRIFRTPEAAHYLGLSPSTLEKKRLDGSGPPFVRLGGRAVGYDLSALDEWLDRQKHGSTSDTGVPD